MEKFPHLSAIHSDQSPHWSNLASGGVLRRLLTFFASWPAGSVQDECLGPEFFEVSTCGDPKNHAQTKAPKNQHARVEIKKKTHETSWNYWRYANVAIMGKCFSHPYNIWIHMVATFPSNTTNNISLDLRWCEWDTRSTIHNLNPCAQASNEH